MMSITRALLWVSLVPFIVTCIPNDPLPNDIAALNTVISRNNGRVPERYKLLHPQGRHERRNGQSHDVLASITKAIEEARSSNDSIPLPQWESLPGDSPFMKLRILDSYMDEDELEVFAPSEYLSELVAEPVQSISLSNDTRALFKREDICGTSKQEGQKPCAGSKLSDWTYEASKFATLVGAVAIAAPHVVRLHFDGLRGAIQAGRRLRAEWRITDGRNNVGNGPRTYPAITYPRHVKRTQIKEVRAAQAYSNTGKVTVAYQRASRSNVANDATDKQWGCIFASRLQDMVGKEPKQQQRFTGMQHGGTWWGVFDYCIYVDGGRHCYSKCGFGKY